MESQDFLAAVLPSSGNYCVAELSTARKQHIFTPDITRLVATALDFDAKGLDAYFALASFGAATNRTAVDAVAMRALFLDIDCNGVKGDKEYASKQEGGMALYKFIDSVGLNHIAAPYVLSSGGGLHVYWVLDADANIPEWKSVAEDLKALCAQQGFKIDHSVTADASRILRVPGTRNFKIQDKPRTVRLLKAASGVVALTEFGSIVRNALKDSPPILATRPSFATPQFEIAGERPVSAAMLGASANKVTLVENSVTFFKNIDDATTEGRGCAQLDYYKTHASTDGMEPLWYALVSLAKCCDDGYEYAQALGDMHPYAPDRLATKWHQTKGPTPCAKFDSLNHGVCSGCSHFGKITNPLVLGREFKKAVAEVAIEAKMERSSGDVVPVTFVKPTPPKNFFYGQKGGVFAEVLVPDPESPKSGRIPVEVMILSYDLFVVDILEVEDEHLVHMAIIRPTGVQEITFPTKATVTKDETLKALAMRNVIPPPGDKIDIYLYQYVKACVEHASTNKHTVKVPTGYGWQEDNSFVWASTIYYPNGTHRYIPMPSLANINTFSGAVGTFENWRRVVDMLVARQLWDILTMGLIGPASLLMHFTGHSGVTYHMGSTESGTGKSLAQMLAASFFAHPERYRVTQSTSDVALQQRAGMLRNFPIITDEITSKNRNSFEWVAAYLLDKSQGKGKDRMEAGANRERVNTTEWKSMDLFSSNTHILDFLSGARAHASQAEILRVLEMKLNVVLRGEYGMTSDETDAINGLKTNYGVVGERIIKWLVTNRETAAAVVRDCQTHLDRIFEATGDERFWSAGNSCILAMALLLSDKYMGIINLPIGPIVKSLKKMVDNGRRALVGSKRSAEDILNAYTRENFSKFIVLYKREGTNPHEVYLGSNKVDETAAVTRSDVAGRVEHDRTPGWVDYFIEERLLKQHCSAMSYGFSDLVTELATLPNYAVKQVRKDMLSQTNGPALKSHCLKISRKKEVDTEALSGGGDA